MQYMNEQLLKFLAMGLLLPSLASGLDTWDRSTCPWEWFSEAGPDNPGDKHVNTCHTSATARFFCKRCKNPHGYHPTKLRGKGLGERTQEREGKK